MSFETRILPGAVDVVAPDGSEIRLLPALAGGSMVHCRLPPGAVTLAVRHRTVEELWYVVGGRGEIWRRHEAREEVAPLVPGVSATIPLGTHFQFRAASDQALELVLVTMPPWPGPDEAVRVPDHWEPTVSG
ncbi:MAG: cupin domain-containing protein [Rhodospirillaceae bacterium]|jgi:mannose-6-phosphate isomerase-like protein (cupin superfamily)|nr:cupin domain-containing protein [Rhodospirillaceae bacterium]MBT6118435.1 cupin domain-containing protein [Rhodospirillaceae bacterium]